MKTPTRILETLCSLAVAASLVACAPSAAPTPRPQPTASPTMMLTPAPAAIPTGTTAPERVAPARNATIPEKCRVAGQQTFVNAQAGFCFAYPSRFTLGEFNPGEQGVFGPALDKSSEPVRASLQIEVQPVPGGSNLGDLVTEFLRQFDGMNIPPIERRPAEIGGEQAERVSIVPGYTGSTDVFALHDNTLYRLLFMPSTRDFPQARTDVDELNAAVISSFSFFPKRAGPLPALAETGKSISGQVRWGSSPVPGARVQLRIFDLQANKWVAVAETISDGSGQYVLENPPVGDYSIGALWPDEQEAKYGGESINITPGKTIKDLKVALTKEIELLEPAPAAEVGATPTLRWESFPGAKFYRVLVTDAGTTEPIVNQTITDTQLVVTTPLKPGHTYRWTVVALEEDEQSYLASLNNGEFKVTGIDPTPTPGGSETEGVPPECQVRNAHARQYVNRYDNYCFLYPARFELRELGTGSPGLFGPALDKSADPLRASLQMEVEVAVKDANLQKVVDAYLKLFADMNIPPITRSSIRIGGEPAEVLEGVPGRGGSRDVFMLHNGTLFHFMFMPDVNGFPQAAQDVEELFDTVTASFAFLLTPTDTTGEGVK